jgi:prepilin-type N-terminal cleavage/methylation domain-containing protein
MNTHDPSACRRACAASSPAFTLIELLVVISIISLLVSILLPALTHAREAARRSVCGSNMHQFGIAYYQYNIDNRGRMPSPSTYNDLDGTAIYRTTPAFISAYGSGVTNHGLLYSGRYLATLKVFYDPSAATGLNTDTNYYPYTLGSAADTAETYWGYTSNTPFGSVIFSTYSTFKLANVQRPGTTGSTDPFEDAFGYVSLTRDTANDTNRYIAGKFDNNLRPTRTRNYKLLACNQHNGNKRFAHGGDFTNLLSADGSVKPNTYDFFNTITASLNANNNLGWNAVMAR